MTRGVLIVQQRALQVHGRSLNRNTTPDSGAEHQYDHLEAAGTTLSDSVGSLDGTINNATWTPGEGTGDVHLNYNGSTQYVDLGALSRSALSHWVRDGRGTVSMWVYLDSDGSGTRTLIGSTGTGVNIGFILRVTDTNSYTFFVFNGSGGTSARIIDISDVGAAPTDTWFNITATADGNTAILYEDGSAVESDPVTTERLVNSDFDNNVSLGRNTNGDIQYLSGKSDLTFFDNKTRTQPEIQEWMNVSSKFYY